MANWRSRMNRTAIKKETLRTKEATIEVWDFKEGDSVTRIALRPKRRKQNFVYSAQLLPLFT